MVGITIWLAVIVNWTNLSSEQVVGAIAFLLFCAAVSWCSVRESWQLCYSATRDGHILFVRRLGRSRKAVVGEVQKITASGGGGGGFSYVMHLPGDRLVLLGRNGRSFAEDVLRASPKPIPTQGWQPDV